MGAPADEQAPAPAPARRYTCSNSGGADPLVRAGPPGPALQALTNTSTGPTRASAADQGVRPTLHSWDPRSSECARLQPYNLDRPVTARELNQPSAAADPAAHLPMSVLIINVDAVELRGHRRVRCVRAHLGARPGGQMQHDG